MPKRQVIQREFTAGELSPRFHSRSDIKGYAAGLELCENFIALKHGPVVSRPGLRHIGLVSTYAPGRLFPYALDSKLSGLIHVDTHGVRFLRLGDQLTTVGEQGFSTLAISAAAWRGSHSATGGYATEDDGDILLTSSTTGSYASIYRTATVVGPATIHLHIAATHRRGDTPLSILVGTAADPTAYADIDIPPTNTDELTIIEFPLTGTTQDVVFRARADGDAVWRVETFRYHASDTLAFTEVSGPRYDDNDILFMQAVPVPGTDEVWLVTPKKKPYKVAFTFTDRAISDEYTAGTSGEIAFTAMPEEWNDEDGYPGALGFAQQRSWWSGHPLHPDTVWVSQGNSNYADMTTISVVGEGEDAEEQTEADDGFNFTLAQDGFIRWVIGAQDLLIGAETGEYVVQSSGVSITPEDHQILPQSAHGSRGAQPRRAGNSVLYTSQDGTKVREIEYKFSANGWESRDLTFTSEHIPREYGPIKEIHYAKDPENIIWCVTEGGYLIGCTFEQENKVVGWHRHTTQGRVVSAAVTKRKGEDALWLLVDRGDGSMRIEGLDRGLTMDAAINRDFAVEQTSIGGYPSLAGQTCQVLLDGAIYDDVTLDADGNHPGAVPAYRKIQIGLGYTARLRTLPLDRTQGNESSRASRKAWKKIFLNLLDSYIPIINGDRLPTIDANIVDDGSPQPITGDIELTTGGHDYGAQITVEEPLPLRTQITGIYGEITESMK